MNPFRRLLHRRCDAAIDGLAEAADDQTYRAETVEADLHTAEHEVHQVREDRARMVCTACGHHWGLPRYLDPVLDGQRWRPANPAGGRTPLAEERPAVLAAVDAALPPAPAEVAEAAA